MRILLALVALLAFGVVREGHAGAWPRGDGDVFLSVSRMTEPLGMPELRAGRTSLYGEYGLGDRITLGAKIERTFLGDTSTTGFARWHFSPTGAATQLAGEIGLGRLEDGTGADPALTLAAIAGRGFATGWGNGWAEADLRVTSKLPSGDRWGNLDLTFGIALSERNKIYLQTRTYVARDGSATALAPAYLRSLPWGMTAKLGLEWDVGSGVPPSVEIGTWIEF